VEEVVIIIKIIIIKITEEGIIITKVTEDNTIIIEDTIKEVEEAEEVITIIIITTIEEEIIMGIMEEMVDMEDNSSIRTIKDGITIDKMTMDSLSMFKREKIREIKNEKIIILIIFKNLIFFSIFKIKTIKLIK
jgi:hypothetical protein